MFGSQEVAQLARAEERYPPLAATADQAPAPPPAPGTMKAMYRIRGSGHHRWA